MNEQDIYKHIAKTIRLLRMKSNLSQEALSLKSGLNRAYVGHIERGYKRPTIETLKKISNALDVPISQLFEGYK